MTIFNVYYDSITDQLWLCDGDFISSEMHGEIFIFPFTELFMSDELVLLGEL